MDLHGIVSPVTAIVTAPDTATLEISTGASPPNAAGKRIPTTQKFPGVSVDVQAMSSTDIHMTDGLNLTGVKRAIYVHGQLAGIARPFGKGGDTITIASGVNAGVWLVAIVLENWPDWCKVAATLQNAPAS